MSTENKDSSSQITVDGYFQMLLLYIDKIVQSAEEPVKPPADLVITSELLTTIAQQVSHEITKCERCLSFSVLPLDALLA